MSAKPVDIELTGALRVRGTFSRWDGTELVVRAPSPAPPGARLDAVIAHASAEGAEAETGRAAAVPFKMKAIRCRKVEDGRFEITLRVLELSRAAREELEAVAALAAAAAGAASGAPERARDGEPKES